MANTPDYSWPPMASRKVIGQSIKRLDGPQRRPRAAPKYASDKEISGMLHACYLTSPHAHAKVNAIDTSAAEKRRGVRAVHVVAVAARRFSGRAGSGRGCRRYRRDRATRCAKSKWITR
jgi:CO/xanthine dehydrogenase Mo-binding subunit